MAVYRLSAAMVQRSAGRSATAAAAYRAGERIHDERTGVAHDYRRRSGVEYAEILAPANAPGWMRDRARLWNAVERSERRKDAQLAREVQLALPHELTPGQRVELVRAYVREQFVAKGMVADVAIHAPDRFGDGRNHHAHVLLTLRAPLGEGFGGKQRGWNATGELERWREAWAEHQNRALERARVKARVDHRSYARRGVEREPEPKLGPYANALERRGARSERGDERRRVRGRNRERAELRREAEVIELALAREERERRRREREREVAREKWRFEGWANRKRAELQNRRLDDAGELGRRHQRQRENLEDELAATYGPGWREAKEKLAALERRREAGGILYRAAGRAERDRERAAALRRTLADIERREGEQRGKLARVQEAEKAAQAALHRRRERRLEERIADAYARREAEGWRPLAKEREVANDRPEPGLPTWAEMQRQRRLERGLEAEAPRGRELPTWAEMQEERRRAIGGPGGGLGAAWREAQHERGAGGTPEPGLPTWAEMQRQRRLERGIEAEPRRRGEHELPTWAEMQEERRRERGVEPEAPGPAGPGGPGAAGGRESEGRGDDAGAAPGEPGLPTWEEMQRRRGRPEPRREDELPTWAEMQRERARRRERDRERGLDRDLDRDKEL